MFPGRRVVLLSLRAVGDGWWGSNLPPTQSLFLWDSSLLEDFMVKISFIFLKMKRMIILRGVSAPAWCLPRRCQSALLQSDSKTIRWLGELSIKCLRLLFCLLLCLPQSCRGQIRLWRLWSKLLVSSSHINLLVNCQWGRAHIPLKKAPVKFSWKQQSSVTRST